MALGKLTVFFAVLLVCQASFVKQSKVKDDDTDAEYVSIAKTLGNGINLITNVLGDAVNDLKTFVNYGNGENLEDLKEKTTDIAKNVLGVVKSLIAIDLINLKNDGADEDTVVLADCLLANGDNYVDVIASFWELYTTCHNPSLSNLTTQISSLLDDVSSTIKEIQESDSQLDDCSDLTCIVSVFADMLDKVTGFTAAHKDKIEGVRDAIASWGTNVVTCVQSSAAEWKQSAGQEIATFAKCVRS